MATSSTTPHMAEAGRRGDDVRSDCYVRFEPRDSGGIELELKSRVEPYYGDNIRAQARELLEGLGVRHARVVMEDQGALPFVLAARIEAAARRSGLVEPIDVAARRASRRPQLPETKASPRDRLRRSRLYLPGNEPKYFINAALHEPDAVILDLEDSVHSGEKDAARILVRNALREVDFHGCERMVRINQLPLGMRDLQEVVPELPDLILIPKVETHEQVVQVDTAIQDFLSVEHKQHIIWLMPILESAVGIENAYAIAKASDRAAALTIGLEDYTADLGVMKTRAGEETLYARSRLVNAAHAASIQAIDSVYGDIGDLEGLRTWALRARAMGFEGMGCVHPSQIRVIHEAFAPSPEELERAQKIVAAYDDAKVRGLGVVSLGSKMIDAPVVNRAVKLVNRAKQMGLL